jgi:hypothetical protein
MKPLQTISKIMFTALLLTALNPSTQAQKLKSVQETSVWAPANVKVDGKLKEWDDSFQAYNKTTDVFYTIANDDQNLYFVIKSTLPMNNNKIMAGGMDFTINTAGKKSEKDAYKIIFPLIDMSSLRNQMMSARPGGGGGAPNVTVMRAGGGGTFVSGAPMPPGAGGPPDSTAIAAMRKRALGNIKEIKLIGFAATDIPDSVISIYNEYGVKAAVDYDAKGNLTCEIAVPLKYLRLATDGPKEFAYNIKLNGLNLSSMLPPGMPMPMPGGGGGGADVVVVGRSASVGGGGGGDMPRGMPSMNDMQSMISPTDFWGKYTLAKK